MDKDIIDGSVGKIGMYDVAFKDGSLVGKLGIQAKAVDEIVDVQMDISVSIGADAIIEAIKKAIPGTIDDAILDIVKVALKSI